MKILVANLGSTSLKYRLFDFSGGQERLLTRGGFERLTDHCQGIEDCLAALQKENWIANENDLAAVGFKTIMARGITGCVRLDESVVRSMEDYNTVAPAHNPPYIAGIRMFAKRLPGVPLVGLFETAFYQWAPEEAMRYAIPEEWHQAGVRRWGFHGASHKFIAERSAELLCREDVAERTRQLYVDDGRSPVRQPELRVVSCHLGGSSSVTGIRNGVAIGNSLGFSPQSGLAHNNRVGDLDAFVLPFLMRTNGLTLDEAERVLCKESGLKALSGGYNDIRDIVARAEQGNAQFVTGSARIFYNSMGWTRWCSQPASAKITRACAMPFAATSINLASFSIPSSTRKLARGRPSSARLNPPSRSSSFRPMRNWSSPARCAVFCKPINSISEILTKDKLCHIKQSDFWRPAG
jgi:acetate kinase